MRLEFILDTWFTFGLVLIITHKVINSLVQWLRKATFITKLLTIVRTCLTLYLVNGFMSYTKQALVVLTVTVT